MTLTRNTFALIISLALLTIAAVLAFAVPSSALGSAPSGLQATVATSSNPTVTSSASVVFATSTCAARIISTGASAVMLTFSDNQGKTPTATYGHLQSASTTVAYDSGLYGCGLVKAYSFASQAITVTETR